MPYEQLTPRPLTKRGIQTYAPPVSGVYGISNAREWLHIGQADDIRDALVTYLKNSAAKEPVGFVFEVCSETARLTRQHRLVVEYKPSGGSSPPLTNSTSQRRQQ